MNTNTFLTFILALFSGWILMFIQFKGHFANPQKYVDRIEELHKYNEMAEIKQILLKDQLIQFQIDVSEILPQVLMDKKKDEKNYPLRNLASIVSAANVDVLKVEQAKASFELAKSNFRKGDFEKTRTLLVGFLDKYPFSVHITEAFFLLGEAHYRLEDYERCVLTIEQMLELFPESELTGFAMLRIGKIYEYKDRPEEAVDIYKTVLKTFPDRDIASQARESLRTIEL